MKDTMTKLNNLFQSTLKDPLNVRDNFYVEVSELLRDLKTNREMPEGGIISLRERIAAMAMIGRMTLILGLGKESNDELAAGSSVRKYETAFKTHGSGRRAKRTRPTPKFDAFIDSDDGDGDGDPLSS